MRDKKRLIGEGVAPVSFFVRPSVGQSVYPSEFPTPPPPRIVQLNRTPSCLRALVAAVILAQRELT